MGVGPAGVGNGGGSAGRSAHTAPSRSPPFSFHRPGHDLISLLYNFLDACLYAFTSDDFICKDFVLLEIVAPGVTAEEAAVAAATCAAPAGAGGGALGAAVGAGGPSPAAAHPPAFRISVLAYGERFRYGEHAQGTEVKAITYSNMQIFTPWGRVYSAGGAGEAAGSAGGADTRGEEEGAGVAEATEEDPHRPTGRRRGPWDVYVIVDI